MNQEFLCLRTIIHNVVSFNICVSMIQGPIASFLFGALIMGALLEKMKINQANLLIKYTISPNIEEKLLFTF